MSPDMDYADKQCLLCLESFRFQTVLNCSAINDTHLNSRETVPLKFQTGSFLLTNGDVSLDYDICLPLTNEVRRRITGLMLTNEISFQVQDGGSDSDQ